MAFMLLDQYLESHLKVTKLDDKIQSSLVVFQNVFKFIPSKLFRYSKNVNYGFGQLTKSDEDLICDIFIHTLAPFVFGQNSFVDKGLQNLYQFIVDLQSESFFKFEEADVQHEIKVLTFIELIWKTVLDIYCLFNPLELCFNEVIGKLNECEKASDIIGVAKPLCKDFNGLSTDLEVAISAFIIIKYYRKRLSGELNFTFEDQQNALNLPTNVNDNGAAISILEEIYKNCPFNYLVYVKIAKIFLDQKLNSYAKWAAYRAILICPTYIDSYSIYFEAKLNDKATNRSIFLALNCLSQEVPIFKGSSYNSFSFLKELAISQKEVICEKKILPFDEILELKNIMDKNVHEETILDKIDKCSGRSNSELESIKDLVLSIKASDSLKKNLIKEECNKNEGHKNVGCDELKENVLLSKSIILEEKNFFAKKGKKTKSDLIRFQKTAREGSEAICNSSYMIAIEKYESALNFAAARGESKLGISTIEIIILKYCLAMAYIYKHTYEDIKIGITNLDNILFDYPLISFPLAYYGQATGFIAQNRFQEAKLPLNILRNVFDSNVQVRSYSYPGSDKDIPESRLEELKKLVEEFGETCRMPPPPVGLCFFENDNPFHYKEIYYSDPNFYGFAHLICTDRCHLYFHNHCWDVFKENHKLRHKKDWNEFKCVTPDCKGCLLKIEIFGADGNIRKEICPEFKEQITKEKAVAPLSNSKLKAEIKELIKSSLKRRKRSTSEKSEENDKNSRDANVNLVSKCAFPDFRLDGIPLCKKKLEMTDFQQKPKKTSKINSSKVIVDGEFYSSDHERLEELRQLKDKYCDDGYIKSKQSTDESSEIPLSEINDCGSFKSDFINLEEDLFSTKKYITNYLETIVDVKGCPIRIDDKYILDNLAAMPIEAQNLIINFGGIETFFNESMKYRVLDEFIVPNSIVFAKNIDDVSRVKIDNNPGFSPAIRTTSSNFDKFKVGETPILISDDTSKPPINKLHLDEKNPVYFIIKKLLGLSLDEQLEVGRMIIDLAKATQPSDYNPTKEDLTFESICHNGNSSYKIVTKSEATIINDIDNIRRTIELFRSECEVEKQKNVQLMNETIHLKNTKSTLLEGIASFMEASEKDKIVTNDHIQRLRKDNDKLVDACNRTKEVIAVLNKEITKLRDDHTKMMVNQDKKMFKLLETQHALEEERNKLKLDLENMRRELKGQKGSKCNQDSSQTQHTQYQRPFIPRLQGKSVLNQNVLTSCKFSKFGGNMNSAPGIPQTNNSDCMSETFNEWPNMGAESFQKKIISKNDEINNIATYSFKPSNSASLVNPPQTSFKELNLLNETKNDVSFFKSSDFKLHLSSIYSKHKSLTEDNSVQSHGDTLELNLNSDLGTYWQIVQILQPEFPTFKRNDFTYYLTILRKENGNTLSGLKIGDIISKFKQTVANKKLNQSQVTSKMTPAAAALDALKFTSRSSSAWKPVPTNDLESNYTDDICAICHEKMENDIYKLRCGHVHHFKCLEDWYKHQTTCPICREHCPLFCDYPPLQ